MALAFFLDAAPVVLSWSSESDSSAGGTSSALTPKNASSSACSLHMGAVYLLVGSG